MWVHENGFYMLQYIKISVRGSLDNRQPDKPFYFSYLIETDQDSRAQQE